jgi:hypothetical protein
MWSIKNLKKKNSNRGGFTIMELLVASSILVMIGLAVLMAFGSGFRVYERVQAYGGDEADALLALEEMERGLRNIFFSPAMGFTGDMESIRFPAIMERTETVEKEEKIIPAVGQVAYYLAEIDGEKTLVREQRNYGEAVAGAAVKEDRKAALAAVTELKFAYYTFNADEQTYAWKDSWIADEKTPDKTFPSAVKIDMVLRDGNRVVPLARTVVIPSIRLTDDRADMGAEPEEEGAAGDG